MVSVDVKHHVYLLTLVSVFFQLPDRAVLKKCRPRKVREWQRGHSQMQKKWLPKGK